MAFKNFILLLVIMMSFSCENEEEKFDIIIVNGTVFNGEESDSRSVSIAIKDDKIVFVGNLDSIAYTTNKIIDASGLIVSPGFIDPHTHADRDLVKIETASNLPFLYQGVTTVIVGNDGNSFYPTSKYADIYASQGIGTNVVPLVGHGTIRTKVVGKSNRLATSHEIEEMKELIRKEMDDGAFGISTGLYYSPGNYANTEEVIDLSKVVAKRGGIYDTHLRDEGIFNIGVAAAVKEAIEIGEKAEIPIHISHIKCLGVDVWEKSDTIIKIIEQAQNRGLNITANQYPYDASSTSLTGAVVPRWAQSGGLDSLLIRYNDTSTKAKLINDTKENIRRRGGPQKILIVKSNNTDYLNKTLSEIAEDLDRKAEETVYEILKEGNLKIASFNMTEDDILNFMKQEWVVTGSDGNEGHPRKYGSFPRKYRLYVIEKEVINLSEFINNSTSKTAEIFNIVDRGKIKEGFFADIIIFNPENFKDTADFEDAFKLAEGLEYSLINGELMIDKENYTGRLAGRVLKQKKINLQ